MNLELTFQHVCAWGRKATHLCTFLPERRHSHRDTEECCRTGPTPQLLHSTLGVRDGGQDETSKAWFLRLT